MTGLCLRFLGPAEVSHAGTVVEFNIAKVQAMLAYLAITGLPQRREHLLDLLWSESHPEAARKNLRNSLWRTRRALGDDVLMAEGDTIMLSTSVWIDAVAFETGIQAQFAQAVPDPAQILSLSDLWRGPLLAEINLPDAPGFDLWLIGERERLGQTYLRSLRHLLGVYRAASRWHEIITVGRRALEHDVTQESIHVALMDAYAKLGQRSDALRQYETLRTALEREVGVAPSTETEALKADILGGKLGASRSLLPERSADLRLAPKLQPSTERPFVGRQAERTALDQAMQAAGAGRLQIALISGELGIGKSYLWRQWAAQLPPEATILEARCLDATQSIPFAPLTGLLGTRANLERVCGPQSPVSPVWLTELARLMPQVRDYRPDLPDAIPLPPQEERRRIFEAFVQTLRSFAATPPILFIDDLHWADQATLDWLVYLIDRMYEEPLLLVGAFRVDDASPDLMHFSSRWDRTGMVHRLMLSPLTLEESSKLIAALEGNEDLAESLHSKSGGNPYFLTELNQAYPDEVPTALGDLISARLGSLSESAQRLLHIAAMLEPAIDFSTLQLISAQHEESTLNALDTLLDKSILVERGDVYEFTHPLLAAIVRRGLSLHRRRNLHRRVAEYLEGVHREELEAVAGQLTLHYSEAGAKKKAAHYAEIAAGSASEMGAAAEAVNFYRQSYLLEPTPGRQLELGYSLMQVPGGLHEARELMQQALNESANMQDQKGVVQAGLRLAISYLSTEEGEKVLYWAEKISAHLGETEDIALRATIQYLMGSGKFHLAKAMTQADVHFSEATRLAAKYERSSDIAVQSWFGWGNLSVQCGDFAQAQAKFRRSLELAQATRNIYFEALGHNNLAYSTFLAADLPGARFAIDRGIDFLSRHELMRPRQYLYSTKGEITLAEGDPDGAESWFAQASEEAQTYDNEAHVNNVRAHLGRTAQAKGDLDRAEILLSTAHQALPATGARHMRIQFELWLAELHLLRNDRERALIFLASAQEALSDGQRKALIRSAAEIERMLEEPESSGQA